MSEAPRRSNPWPVFIGLLVLCFVAVTGWSVHKAASESSPPVNRVTGDK